MIDSYLINSFRLSGKLTLLFPFHLVGGQSGYIIKAIKTLPRHKGENLVLFQAMRDKAPLVLETS